MDSNNTYFYTSGLISLSLFTFFLLLIIQTLFSNSKIDAFALKKDNYISISLETPKVQKSTKTIPQKQEEQVTPVESKEINIDELFSDVWTKDVKKIKPKEEKIDNKRLQEIAKKSKIIDKDTTGKSSQKVLANDMVKNSEDSQKDSSADAVNEYFAKIQALVYQNFFPPSNTQGHSVKAVIELSSIGKVIDFRILTYSANGALNEESDKIKNRLLWVLFPINPQNKSGTYTIVLKAKE
ncbi:MAG: TonB C-terminal domain-containing protein [Sulfurimonas sp.]|uniref:TonB C-terminal domain-containing protein n=1 Tax=Sulfurimonas sp. TaxID=2022749 RepID=UPI0025FDCAD1|nr:TonB C-terminal domain-containing protein [Sulfurimonas sp.]MCK9492407.1 TonB C-terminal domain-containing protein [Sulfurimonas sp.]